MIGLQLGTLVAQVVIIGDLGPAIVSKALGLPNTANLRTGFIIFLCLFLGLPLGLLKDVRMLSNTSTLCIMFYTFFSVYVIIQSIPNLLKGQWYNKVTFWRMEGFFQCLPIFSFAFGCQTQMFIVYDALAEPSLKRMNNIVSSAVNMCAVAYLLVGFFGNVAFCDTEISGDIINHFEQNAIVDGIKLCFVFSIAVSIPLIVFPCRVSLYNLLFPQKPKEDIPMSGKIPEFHFKVITIFIIVGSMVIGIMVPNVEFVLGLNGATMGTLICYIFPALFFLGVMSSSSEGKWTARLVLVFGLTILIASTYTTLSRQEKKVEAVRAEDLQISNNPADTLKPAQEHVEKIIEQIKPPEENKKEDAGAGPPVNGDSERKEPPNPQAPDDKEIDKEIEPKDIPEKIDKHPDGEKDVNEEKKDKDTALDKDNSVIEKDKLEAEKKDGDSAKVVKVVEEEEQKDNIEKEDKEKLDVKEKKQDEILGKLAEQQVEQQKLIHEQKQILEELKQHKEEHIEKEKKEASENKDKQNVQNIGNQHDLANQPLQNQQMGGQQVAMNQQDLPKQPLGGQQPLQNQQLGQQVLQNQVLGGQQAVQNQQLGGQQILPNQQIGGQQALQNQQLGGQQILQNQQIGGQQLLQNQQLGGQQQFQNQPVVAGQQQLVNQNQGILQNDLNLQNLQQVPLVPQQAQNVLPAANAGGQQAVGNIPVQNVQAGNADNIGLQNMQGGQQQIGVAQQMGNQAGVQQEFIQQAPDGNIQHKAEVVEDQNIQGAVNKPNVNIANQQMGNVVQKDAVKDDTLKRKKRDTGFDSGPNGNNENMKVAEVHEGQNELKVSKDKVMADIKVKDENVKKDSEKLDVVVVNEDEAIKKEKGIPKDETGNIQRDLKQIPPTVKVPDTMKFVEANQDPVDNVDEMIDSMKKDLYLDGNRKSPFIVEMANTNLGSKRR